MTETIRNLEKLAKILKGAKSQVMLKDFTTFHTGGPAELFFEAKTSKELIFAASEACKLGVPYFVLGGGSNVLISDAGFPGLVIKNSLSGLIFLPETSEVIAESGVSVVRLVTEAAARELGGIEHFITLPGTIGGALFGNAECFGEPLSEFVSKVTLFVFDNRYQEPKLLAVDPEWFEYDYRDSKLKRLKGYFKPIIVSAKFKLRHRKKEDILADIKEYREKRARLYQPLAERSAGCFFKNPGGKSHGKEPLPKEQTAGYLIEQAGLKGKRLGGAMVSKLHANFIINYKNATSNEIWQLAQMVKKRVKEMFNIELKEEVELVGPFWEEKDL